MYSEQTSFVHLHRSEIAWLSEAPPAERVASSNPLKKGEKQSISFATFPLSCSRAPQKLPKKEFEVSGATQWRRLRLFQHPARGYKLREFSNSRQVRGVPFQGINSGNSAESGANDWCLFFWFVFFGQAVNRQQYCMLTKKKNRLIQHSPDR